MAPLPALTRPTGHGTAPAARRQPQALALSSLLLASCRARPQATTVRCRAQNGSGGQQQRRLLVAVEDTQESFNTVKWALENVYRPGDVLHFLHVLPKRDSTHSHVPMRGADLGSMGSMDYEDDLETYALGFLTKTMVRLAHRHNADCEVDLIKVKGREPVGTSICKHAEKLEASMVIVSAHQRSFIEEVFFESVSKHVVQHCKQPTIVVPLQRTAARPAQVQAAPQRAQHQQQQQLQAAPAAVQATQHNLAR